MHDLDSSPIFGVDYNDQNIIDSINGVVHANGLKFDIRAWLDIGSSEWKQIDDEQRRSAFLVVKNSGWTKQALRDIMLRNYSHLNDSVMDLTFDMLEA